MKRFFILFSFGLILFLSLNKVTSGKVFENFPVSTPVPEIIHTEKIQPLVVDGEKALRKEVGIPRKILIPKIGVNAAVESVGLDAQGRMDVPKLDENTAWYNLGYKAGENGSAVIAGHFDNKFGGPAVFYNLSDLEAGDEIIVIDNLGNEYTFVVSGKKLYGFDQLPLEQIFASSGKARLNLITCDGAFDRATKNYSQRLVVYSEKI